MSGRVRESSIAKEKESKLESETKREKNMKDSKRLRESEKNESEPREATLKIHGQTNAQFFKEDRKRIFFTR